MGLAVVMVFALWLISHALHWSAAALEVALLVAVLFIIAGAAISNAKAAYGNEELKSAVLDALAHDVKTPLTSIKASICTLIARKSDSRIRKENC